MRKSVKKTNFHNFFRNGKGTAPSQIDAHNRIIKIKHPHMLDPVGQFFHKLDPMHLVFPALIFIFGRVKGKPVIPRVQDQLSVLQAQVDIHRRRPFPP